MDKVMGTQTYASTKVSRYLLDEQNNWVLVETFTDATVRDQGQGGLLRAEQAMLRAYSNDPDFFGDEKYQRGNGIYVVNAKQAKNYFNDPDMEGWVMDCDGDIALKRIMMDAVVSRYNFGHGHMEYVGVVGEDDGWDLRKIHLEKWVLSEKD